MKESTLTKFKGIPNEGIPFFLSLKEKRLK